MQEAQRFVYACKDEQGNVCNQFHSEILLFCEYFDTFPSSKIINIEKISRLVSHSCKLYIFNYLKSGNCILSHYNSANLYVVPLCM